MHKQKLFLIHRTYRKRRVNKNCLYTIKLFVVNLLFGLLDCSLQKDVTIYCDNIKGLTMNQRHFCYMHRDIAKIFIDGSKRGYDECQRSFAKNSFTRWNCTNISDDVMLGVPQARGK